MSYSLAVYLVDLDELRRIVGSKNWETLESLSTLRASEHDRSEKAPQGRTDAALSLDTALEHLVFGTAKECDHAHMYGYALERICQCIGERLESSLFETTSHFFLDEVGYVLPLVERGSPVAIPGWQDFPVLGFLTRHECRTHAEVDLDHPHQEVRAGKLEFSEWVEAATLENTDLAGFWY